MARRKDRYSLPEEEKIKKKYISGVESFIELYKGDRKVILVGEEHNKSTNKCEKGTERASDFIWNGIKDQEINLFIEDDEEENRNRERGELNNLIYLSRFSKRSEGKMKVNVVAVDIRNKPALFIDRAIHYLYDNNENIPKSVFESQSYKDYVKAFKGGYRKLGEYIRSYYPEIDKELLKIEDPKIILYLDQSYYITLEQMFDEWGIFIKPDLLEREMKDKYIKVVGFAFVKILANILDYYAVIKLFLAEYFNSVIFGGQNHISRIESTLKGMGWTQSFKSQDEESKIKCLNITGINFPATFYQYIA